MPSHSKLLLAVVDLGVVGMAAQELTESRSTPIIWNLHQATEAPRKLSVECFCHEKIENLVSSYIVATL